MESNACGWAETGTVCAEPMDNLTACSIDAPSVPTCDVRLRGIYAIAALACAIGLPCPAAAAEAPAAIPVATAAAEQPLPGLDAVLAGLRKGGLVIYFRHGPTEQSGSNAEED